MTDQGREEGVPCPVQGRQSVEQDRPQAGRGTGILRPQAGVEAGQGTGILRPQAGVEAGWGTGILRPQAGVEAGWGTGILWWLGRLCLVLQRCSFQGLQLLQVCDGASMLNVSTRDQCTAGQ